MSTQVAGVLKDPFERPLANTDIDIRAITNTFAVLPGATIKVTTNSQGEYNFILEPANYAVSVILDGRAVYQGAMNITSTTPPGTLPQLLKQAEMLSELPLNYAEYFQQVQATVKDDADRAQAAADGIDDQVDEARQYAEQSQTSAQSSQQSSQTAQQALADTQVIANKFQNLDDAVTETQQNAQQTQSDAAQTASDRAAADAAAQRAEDAAGSAETVNVRNLRVPQSETINALPAASARANSVASFDATGQSTVTPLNSLATLDSNGKVPLVNIPAAAITEVFPVSSQAQMLALAADPGDVAKRTDLGRSFILMSSPASTLSNWIVITDDVLATLAATGPGFGANLIGDKLDFTGSVPLTQHFLNNQLCTVAAFGAIGDGSLHLLSERYSTLADAQAVYPHATSLNQSIDWAALQSAIKWSASSKLPVSCPKSYVINSTLVIDTGGVKIVGLGRTWSQGSTISTPGTFNANMFNITANCSISGMKLQGTANSSFTSNTIVAVSNTNSVRLTDVFFENGYRHILLTDTSFYISMESCEFFGSLYTSIETASTTYSGVDLIMSHCRFLGNNGDHVILFNGLGSAIISDIQASVNNTKKTTICFNTIADGYGGCQMTNCVWETDAGISAGAIASVYVNGTAAKKWGSLWFDNCIITGNAIPAVLLVNVNGAKFSNCGLSSTSSVGVVYYNSTATANGVSFVNCEWSTSGSNAPIRFGAVTNADLSLLNCTYIGSNTFVDIASAAYANIKFINISNCNLGDGSNPVSKTSDNFWPLGSIITRGHQYGGLTKIVGIFTTGSTGAGSVSHSVKDGQKRIASLGGFYKGGSGEAISLNPSLFLIDGGNIYLNGGPNSTRVRVTAIFNETTDAGW